MQTKTTSIMYNTLNECLYAFVVGGLLCSFAQLLIIKTKLTPARILILFMIGGMVLQACGIYKPIHEVVGTGISVPIVGFGAGLVGGAIEYTQEYGILGAFAGGLAKTAFGIGVAMIASYFVSLCMRSRTKY